VVFFWQTGFGVFPRKLTLVAGAAEPSHASDPDAVLSFSHRWFCLIPRESFPGAEPGWEQSWRNPAGTAPLPERRLVNRSACPVAGRAGAGRRRRREARARPDRLGHRLLSSAMAEATSAGGSWSWGRGVKARAGRKSTLRVHFGVVRTLILRAAHRFYQKSRCGAVIFGRL
jgi:hypothetical protein